MGLSILTVTYLSGQCSHNPPRQTLANPNPDVNHIVQSPRPNFMAHFSHTANGRTSTVCQFTISLVKTTNFLHANVSLSHLFGFCLTAVINHAVINYQKVHTIKKKREESIQWIRTSCGQDGLTILRPAPHSQGQVSQVETYI